MAIGMISLWAGLIMAAWFDVSQRRIPNLLNLGIAMLGLVAALTGNGRVEIGIALASAALAFGLMFLPFALHIFRGGDLKLVVAAGFWVGPLESAASIVFGVLFGGIVAVVMVLMNEDERRRIGSHLWVAVFGRGLKAPAAVERERPTVPMGVGFAVGFCVASLGGFEWL